jgi:hypothetical protein
MLFAGVVLPEPKFHLTCRRHTSATGGFVDVWSILAYRDTAQALKPSFIWRHDEHTVGARASNWNKVAGYEVSSAARRFSEQVSLQCCGAPIG